MNQKPSSPSPSSFSTYQFDFGIGSNRNSSKPIRDTKPATGPAYGGAHQPPPAYNRPSWTHQPAPASVPGAALAGGSMVGDIFGRTWTSNTNSTPDLGIPKSNPRLFGDLVGSALNQGKSNSNVPLKAAPPRNSYSMGNLSDSLPKSTANSTTNTNFVKPTWGSADNIGNFSSLGGQRMKSSAGAASNPEKVSDPFGSLMDFGSKNSGKAPMSSGIPPRPNASSSFGAFQNAPSVNSSKSAADSSFGAFQDAGIRTPAQNPTTVDSSFGDFKNAEKPISDLFDMPFSSSGTSKEASKSQPLFAEANDWDMGSEFEGQDHSRTTTELEGLPPPPAGVTAPIATSKGMDNYKQGQYADAIKWLSWAVVLIEKSGNGASASATEVLICRASCYKEVGEYKKAVADCSKVLEHDSKNVSVLLQRAHLYESTEKYRLGTEDLRMVLKIDPGNRLARSTIHRLSKLAD